MSTRNIVRTDWKVYHPRNGFVAACKFAADAAALVSVIGAGAQIKYRHHTIVWTEGKESQPAGESYDFAANTCIERVNAARANAKLLDEQNKTREALRHKQNPTVTGGAWIDTEASSRGRK